MRKERIIFYLGISALIFGLFASVSGIMLPFILAAVLAYLIDPVVDKLETFNLNRSFLSLVVVFCLFIVLFFVLALSVPALLDGLKDLNQMFANREQIVQQKIMPILNTIFPNHFDSETLLQMLRNNSQEISSTLAIWGKKVALSTMKVFDFASIFLITPIVLFYMLKDWDKMLKNINSLLPKTEKSYIRKVLLKIDKKMSSFIRGQLLVGLCLGLIYGVGFSLIGLKLGFLVGLVTGLLSFMPYVGMALGGISAFVIAIFQFSLTNVHPFAMILGVLIFGQLIESMFLSPKLVGDALGLHPLWIIFAVMAGGELGGFIGILIALPVCAIISVLIKELISYYKKTDIYSAKKVKRKESN